MVWKVFPPLPQQNMFTVLALAANLPHFAAGAPFNALPPDGWPSTDEALDCAMRQEAFKYAGQLKNLDKGELAAVADGLQLSASGTCAPNQAVIDAAPATIDAAQPAANFATTFGARNNTKTSSPRTVRPIKTRRPVAVNRLPVIKRAKPKQINRSNTTYNRPKKNNTTPARSYNSTPARSYNSTPARSYSSSSSRGSSSGASSGGSGRSSSGGRRN
jgi:uncharacterized membrane protein YgcG